MNQEDFMLVPYGNTEALISINKILYIIPHDEGVIKIQYNNYFITTTLSVEEIYNRIWKMRDKKQ